MAVWVHNWYFLSWRLCILIILIFLPEIKSISRCIDEDSFTAIKTTCEIDYWVLVQRVFLAKPQTFDQNFCENPSFNETDCIGKEDILTEDHGRGCNTFSKCALYIQRSSLSCPEVYKGSTYVYVQYECLPSMSSLTIVCYQFFK